jgi:murein L,D-transpeptidase YafK
MNEIPESGNYSIKNLINKSLLRNIILFGGGILFFITGIFVYGFFLNLREDTLAERMTELNISEPEDISVIISRKDFSLSLYEDTLLIKAYRVNFGRNVSKPKMRDGDQATPVGEYRICSIDTMHKYFKFMKLNYPNIDDASDGLRKGLISQEEYNRLSFENYYEDCPRTKTVLGGDIGIHGIGRLNSIFKNLPFVYNWTDGSIALSNENIDEIYSVVTKGTKVVIK